MFSLLAELNVAWQRSRIITDLPRYMQCSVRLISNNNFHQCGTRWRSWLTHHATSRKVVASIPDDVIGIFYLHNPSGRTMALKSTKPLTVMSTKNFLVSKGGRCLGLKNLPPSCAECLEIFGPQPPGTLRAVQACNGTALPFILPFEFPPGLSNSNPHEGHIIINDFARGPHLCTLISKSGGGGGC
jgi:hypothetical protein